jgi:hypothetical protein
MIGFTDAQLHLIINCLADAKTNMADEKLASAHHEINRALEVLEHGGTKL